MSSKGVFDTVIEDIPRKLYFGFYSRVQLLAKAINWRKQTGASISMCVKALQAGYSPKSYSYLDIGTKDESLYLSNHQPIQKLNGRATDVLHDKLAVYAIFSEYSENFPTLHGTIHDGRYYSKTGNATLLETVDLHQTVIAKPIHGSEGDGVYKISRSNGYNINGESISEADTEDLFSNLEEDYLVTDYINQHEYADKIAPYSVNSIRLWTVVEPHSGEYQVVRGAHRFGSEQSAPTDNWQNGGVAAPIDCTTGEIQPAVIVDEGGKRQRVDSHPETGSRISGVEIPMWDEVCEIATEAALHYPVARVIAWDFVITDEKPMILEASAQPGINTVQLESGLLEESILRQLLNV